MILIGVNAKIAGDHQGFLDDLRWWEFGIFQQGLRRCLGVGAAAADGEQAQFGFEHIAITGNDQRSGSIGNHEHGFKAAQYAIGAPIFRQFNGGA